MKIKKIELKNHPFFGNASFEFVDATGKIMNNVVLAGENGCGKTQLLNLIYDFSTISTGGEVSNELRKFSVVLSENELQQVSQNLPEEHVLSEPTGEMVITQDFTVQPNFWSRIKIKYQTREEDGTLSYKSIDASHFFQSVNVKSLFRSIFSTVEINYNPKAATSITAKEVDEKVENSIRSGADLATEIQQLLIDIQANDANDLQTWVDAHAGMVPPDSVKNKRMKRFKNAFATVFSNLEYRRVDTVEGKKRVIFSKDGNEIEIVSLSSGEKQIVFRGVFLLRNQQSSKGCFILIDEPEISLHPVWQEKIFNYYRNLFKEVDGVQTSQIFIATHSQYVLKSALENNSDTLIILLSNDTGEINVRTITAPMVLPSITAAELNYVAFDIVSNDYHIELYGYLQNKINNTSVKGCDNYIISQPQYDSTKHQKSSSYNGTTYQTLTTYIRNAIDHPEPARTFTIEQLRTSIELLIELCR